MKDPEPSDSIDIAAPRDVKFLELKLGRGELLRVVARVFDGSGGDTLADLPDARERAIWESMTINGQRIQVAVTFDQDSGSNPVVVPVKPDKDKTGPSMGSG